MNAHTPRARTVRLCQWNPYNPCPACYHEKTGQPKHRRGWRSWVKNQRNRRVRRSVAKDPETALPYARYYGWAC